MPVDLTEYEKGQPFAGDYMLSLGALQARLARAQLVQFKLGKRAIIVLEGLEGSGKADILKLVATALDPRLFQTISIEPGLKNDEIGHWLAPFWAALPRAGRSSFFFHSWYARVLEDKVLGLVDEQAWQRAFDEINEFEAQQRDQGTLVVKLYFHVTEPVRSQRINGKNGEPLLEPLAGPAAMREPSARTAYDEAVRHMLDHNDTRWSPWTVIDANDMSSARIAALTAIANAMNKEFVLPEEGEAADVISLPDAKEDQGA